MALSSQRKQNLVDRFSNLPDHIIHHIFSFLGNNDIPRISVLSRRLRQLCASSPYLYFDSRQFKEKCIEFGAVLDKLLSSRNGSRIHCFRLQWFCDSRHCLNKWDLFNSWIKKVVSYNVQELDIEFCLMTWRAFVLPPCIFSCPSLKELKLNLQGAYMDLPPECFMPLEVLSLDSVSINVVSFGERISTSCSSLKSLKLSNVYGFDNLSITSSSLKDLTFSLCNFALSNLSIACSSLENLTIRKCYFMDVCHLKIVCSSLEDLTISECNFDGLQLSITSSPLKDLTISECNTGELCHINVSADELRTLSMDMSLDSPEGSFFKISAPNLQAFRWAGSPAENIYSKFTSLQDVIIDLESYNEDEDMEFIRNHVVDLLCSLRYAKALELNIWLLEVLFMQDYVPILFDNLDHLVLTVECLKAYQIPAIVSFLMGLLNLKTLTIKCDHKCHVLSDTNAVNPLVNLLCSREKSFYAKYKESENLSLSHQLKEVKIELGQKGEERALVNFLLKHAKGLEKTTIRYSS